MWSRVETAPACSTFFRGRGQRPRSATACGSKRSSFRSGIGRVSDLSLAARQWDREPGRRCGFIAVHRRHRRAKTDLIDGETLLRTLMAWARGERRVCSMVRAPSPEEEDRRRLTRERGTLIKERIQHTNRIRGLLSGQGIRDYNPLRRDLFRTARGAANRRRP